MRNKAKHKCATNRATLALFSIELLFELYQALFDVSPAH